MVSMIENSVMKELRKAIVCKIVQVIVINTKLPLQFEIENKSQQSTLSTISLNVPQG